MSKTQTYHLLQLGVGTVGSLLRDQILAHKAVVNARYGIDLKYCGIFTSNSGIFNPEGLDDSRITAAQFADAPDIRQSISLLPKPFVVIDTTASDATAAYLQYAMELGGSVVTANKRPLAGTQAQFEALTADNRLFFETTVGTGLPIVHTLQSLVATGDEIESIEGCFSGTLGFLFSRLQPGKSFSAAVTEAMALGYTEADPREDLSGMDVARKVVILARLMGLSLEPEAVQLTGLYPDTLAGLTVPEFVEQLPTLDPAFAQKTVAATRAGNVLRYVASITPTSCNVSLQEVALTSDIGQLNGPDNIVVIHTGRYHDNPLVVKGPGAGPAVTAAGVFSDILRSTGVL